MLSFFNFILFFGGKGGRGEACDTVYGNFMSSLGVINICNFLKKDPFYSM